MSYPTIHDVIDRGWSLQAHAEAVTKGDEEAITLTHPVNWLTEEEAENEERFRIFYQTVKREIGSPDISILSGGGSLVIFNLNTYEARNWWAEHVQEAPHWGANGKAVERRYAGPIIEAAVEDYLIIDAGV